MKNVWLRYAVAVLCGLLIFGLGAFCVVSCRSQKSTVHNVNEIEIASLESEVPNLFVDDNFREDETILAYLVLGVAEDTDIILKAYRDPELRNTVTDFFFRLTGSLDIASVVLNYANVFNIDPALAFALCWEESRYKPRALNRNQNETFDRGLFQLNSGTFSDLSVDDFFDVHINARKGLSHLRWCLDYAGTEVAGLAMYNAGSNRVRSSGTPKKTLDYISRILKEQRRIEGLFVAEYARLVHVDPVEEEEEIIKPAAFRLSLLTPLGGR